MKLLKLIQLRLAANTLNLVLKSAPHDGTRKIDRNLALSVSAALLSISEQVNETINPQKPLKQAILSSHLPDTDQSVKSEQGLTDTRLQASDLKETDEQNPFQYKPPLADETA